MRNKEKKFLAIHDLRFTKFEPNAVWDYIHLLSENHSRLKDFVGSLKMRVINRKLNFLFTIYDSGFTRLGECWCGVHGNNGSTPFAAPKLLWAVNYCKVVVAMW